MTENPFSSFIKLVELDRKINRVADKKQAILIEIEQIERACKEKEELIGERREQLRKKRIQRSQYELNFRALQDREKLLRDQRDASSSRKEYEAIEREIHENVRQQREAETVVFDAWKKFDIEEKEFKQAEQELVAFEKNAREELKLKKAQIQDLDQEISVEGKDREKFYAASPAEYLEKYESMRRVVNDPIVPVSEHSCSICSFYIMPADFAALKKNLLVPCKECYRLLYLPQ